MTARIIHSARLVSGGRVRDDAWLLFHGDRIAASGAGETWRHHLSDTSFDARGAWLTPGFIDIHGHGGGGFRFEDGPTAIAEAASFHERHGTTRLVVSLVTASIPSLERQLRDIAGLTKTDPRILGAHLEGPFLSSMRAGAHDSSLLRDPQGPDLDRLLTASSGTLRQITIAPERPGAIPAIRQLVEAGVVVAVGHTDADYTQTLRAIDAGATILTHTFNAMRGLHHREPGPVAAAIGAPHVTLEVVNDGVHVHPSMVHAAFDLAPDRIALVTDAMAAAGAGDGTYVLGSLRVQVENGVARLIDGGAIAGSTLTLDHALRRAVRVAGVPIEQAVLALTQTPAAAIGRADLGSLDIGSIADAVLLNEHLEVRQVWIGGSPLAA